MQEMIEKKSEKIKRNILLNPGPATTTDSVKMAQIVPDICPREKEFASMMKKMRDDLVRIVHGDPNKYTAVLFCGSGTINIDICLNSLLPAEKKILIINNGAYSTRAAEICAYYNLPYIDLKFPVDELPDLDKIEAILKDNPDIALVHTTHNETGTGILNPIREIGALAHRYGAVFTVDTTSTYAMRPIDIEKENIDFCMASAQKGLMAMTGLSFIVGNTEIIQKSAVYPKRSYYCNLYLQYHFFETTGEMHFTPPVQTIYATRQALDEYFAEGEQAKWERHLSVFEAIHAGLDKLGFRDIIKRELQAGLVVSVKYPEDANWDFEKIHDYCYERGFTIYPGKISTQDTFRLCALGAITAQDIADFFVVFEQALREYHVQIPVYYKEADSQRKAGL
ncbi:MAG: 2-aminoethylphosphonate aminotransferase [Lachnospiraceae bacterium]